MKRSFKPLLFPLVFFLFLNPSIAQDSNQNQALDRLKLEKQKADSLFKVNQIESTVELYKTTIENFNNHSIIDNDFLFEIYADLSYCYAYDYLNDVTNQKKYLEKARLVLDEENVNPEKLINFYLDLSIVNKEEGLHDISLGFVTKAKQLMDSKESEFKTELGEQRYLELMASVLENEINTFQLQKDEDAMLKAYDVFKKFYKQNQSKAKLEHLFGQASFRIGRYFQADNVKQAVYFFNISEKVSPDMNLKIYSVICKGFSYISAKEYKNALQTLEHLKTFKNLNIYQELNLHEMSSRCYSELGNLDALIKSTNKALTLLNAKDIEIDVLRFKPDDFAPITAYKYPVLLNQFTMFLETSNDPRLYNTAEQLFRISLKQFADRIDHNPFQKHLANYEIIKNRVLLQMHQSKLSYEERIEALNWMEQIETKSDLNAIRINRNLADNKSELDLLLNKERELRSALTEVRQKQQANDTLSRQAIFELELQLSDLNAKIKTENESIFRILSDSFSISDLNLPTNTSVIKFDKAEDQLFQIHMSQNELNVKSLGEHNQIANQVTDYLNSIKNKVAVNQLNSLSEALFKVLFNDLRLTEETIIIADDVLHYLPFETLRKNDKYIIEQTAITYTNGLAYIAENTYENTTYEQNVTFFAPAYSNFIPSDAQLAVRGAPYDLVGAKQEVKLLSELVDGKVYEDANASKQQFMNLSNNYAIIHLAGHAFLNDTDPKLSNIMFSDNTEDNKLYVSELYGLKNNAELAVLSACNTGVGGYTSGKGLISLSQAFMFSGIPSTVSSLWSAPDNATKDIMIAFYKHLKDGQTKSVSLQKAKLDYLNITANDKLQHPYYWAGFVLYGNNSPVDLDITEPKSLYYWIIGSLALVLGILFFTRNKILKP